MAANVAGPKEGPRDAPIATRVATVQRARPGIRYQTINATLQKKRMAQALRRTQNARLASLVAAIVAGPKGGPRDAPIATLTETAAHARPATTRAATSAIQRKATGHPPLTVRNARLASLVVVIAAGPKEGPRDAPIATQMATVQRARPVIQT